MQLREAFQQIDADGNGQIEANELVNYFIDRGMTQDAAIQVKDNVMEKMDEDGNNAIDMNEFADNFIEIIQRLRHRQIESEIKILSDYDNLKNIKDKLSGKS
jgi:Ca2+-binding EF-hand superfamily protein